MQTKRIVRTAALLALVLALVLFEAAGAGNVHFNSISFSLGSLEMKGDLAGLGNDAADVTLTGYGTVIAMCQNSGGQQAPGRNPIRVTVQQENVFQLDSNGHALVEVTAKDPTLSQIYPSPTPKQAGCPNGNWVVVGIVDRSTDWTSATVVVKDNAGQVQLNLSFKCETSFDNNGVSTDVQCVEN